MTVTEKVEKAIDFLKNPDNANKTLELQNFAGVLGQCMGALGGHPSMIAQYSVYLQQSIPILLGLCSHNSAEIRLVADEALNRVIVGGTPFHSSKVHLHLHNNFTSDKHPRWLRAAISRLCLGQNWLRAGAGRGRIFAQSTLIRLRDIVESIKEPALISDKGDILIMECLEVNLPRIMKALSPYATRDEMFGLLTTLIALLDSSTPSIRRNSANCIAELCQHHPKKFILHCINTALNNLQEKSCSPESILGWFGTLRSIFNTNPINKLSSDTIPVIKYMMIYQICLYYIETSLTNHNILNAAMDCLNIILTDANSLMRSALLNSNGPICLLNVKEKSATKSHHRSLSSISMVQSVMSTASSMANISDDVLISEQSDAITFHGPIYLGSISQNQTPHRSMEDLHTKGINTPDSPCESMISELNSEIMTNEQFSLYIKEKLSEKADEKELEEKESIQQSNDHENVHTCKEINHMLNIGSFNDVDVPLKYCARLLISKFLLAGHTGQIIPDRITRVSVKASALTCLISILDLYPEVLTIYLGIQSDTSHHNLSGNSDQSNTSNNEQLNDFVLERNICYQESLTDSFGQELLTKSIDMMSQASGTGSNKSGASHLPSSAAAAAKRDKFKSTIHDSMENSSLAGIPSNMLDSKQQSGMGNIPNTQMASSCMSGDSINLAMTGSNFTMGSNTTASNYPASTDLLTTSIDPLTSSFDLEMIFDHFGDSTTSLENQTKQTEIERKHSKQFNLEQMMHEMFVSQENLIKYEKQISNESEKNQDKSPKIVHAENMEPKQEFCTRENEENASGQDKNVNESDSAGFENQDNQAHKGQLSNVELTNQHISEFIFLFENHSDPQIRGLVRVCIGSFINSVFSSSSGDYYKWKPWNFLAKNIANSMTVDNLLNIIMEALTDSIHSCVNHSIMAIEKCVDSICNSHQKSMIEILNNLRHVENNPYWLCKVNLCHFYKKLDYRKLYFSIPDWPSRSSRILNILIHLLSDQDQRVRKAAVEAISLFPMTLFVPTNFEPSNMLTNLVMKQTDEILFTSLKKNTKLLSDFNHSAILSALPEVLKNFNGKQENAHLIKSDIVYSNLKCIVHALSYNLMISQDKYFTQGCLESLLDLSLRYPPAKYFHAYCETNLLNICLELLEYRTLSLSCFETVLAFTTQIYAVEAWNALCKSCNNEIKQPSKLDIPKDQFNQKSWIHFGSGNFSSKAENFLKLTLKLLNIFVHIIQDASPSIIQQRSGIIPPSPIRKKPADESQKRSTSPNYDLSDDKFSQKKRTPYNSITGNVIPIGYFVNDIILMKLYANLKSAYSTHKVTINPSSSIFLNFISKSLESLAVQLEVMSEKEIGKVAEEILFYLKSLLPLKPDSSVVCVTQLLRCLFSVNMTAQCNSLQQFFNEIEHFNEKNMLEDFGESKKYKFYENVLLANCDSNVSIDSVMNYQEKLFTHISDSSENNLNHKIAEGFAKYSHLQFERDCYLSVKNFNKHKTDKEWTTHKHEFSKYIRILEPVVVQALKSYTIQNNRAMQCKVLELFNQLLALRINYCFLNSDRVFIDFVLKQLESVEHLEILNCGELVRCIFTFLVHLSSSEHHTKQLMDIPKLIQLCDGLMASEVYEECIESLHPLAYKIFVSQQQIQSRQQVQEAQVTKEVLFSMLQKMMRDPKIVKLISTVLIFSEEHPESHYKFSQLACDALFQLLKQKSIDINSPESYVLLDKMFDCIHREVLFDQSRIEIVLKIMFDKPPNQEYSSLETKERWLATLTLFLRKIIYGLAENEILLSLNYLKTSYVSPAAIFFNSNNEIDPLNVQTVNENCANLSPDVIFVRFLFRVITYALLEIENCNKNELLPKENDNDDHKPLSFWHKLTNGFICQVKHILYLKDGCRFPLLAKTAQTVLHNEQSGLNTGLYSPEENIPLKRLAAICTKLSWIQPLLAIQWCHLLVRLKFIEQKFWGTLLSFLQNSVTPTEKDSQKNLHNDILQLGCFLTLCEHFVDNGLDEAINLTWLLVNRIHYLIKYYNESIVKEFVGKVNENPIASGLLLQAIAARCQPHIKGTYGIKVYKILSNCHSSQSGPLIFCICRIVGRAHVSVTSYFVKLAIKRCQYLLTLSKDDSNTQMPLEDLQMALEMLHKDRVDKRHPDLVNELNNLASTIYNLSPLDIPLDRHINPQNIITTSVDNDWFLIQMRNRCSKYSNGNINLGRHKSLTNILKTMTNEEFLSIITSSEFDMEILQQTLKLGMDSFIKSLINKVCEQEYVKIEMRKEKISKQMSENEEYLAKDTIMDSNIFPDLSKLKKIGKQSRFFVSIENPVVEKKIEILKIKSNAEEEKMDIVIPELPPMLSLSLKHFHKMVQSLVSLFPKNTRPLSHFENTSNKEYQTMDKYTRRCYLVFRDNFFHQLIILVQKLVSAYLQCVKKITKFLDKIDTDAVDKIMDSILSKNLANNLMSFSVISLQYTSYLIKQEEDGFLIDSNGSFKNEQNHIDYIIDLCTNNASQCFSINSIWKELNTEENLPKILSTVNCFYNYMTYILKNTMPITFIRKVSENETSESTLETAITCDRLLTLLDYWQNNCSHKVNNKHKNIMSFTMRNSLETLLVKLCQCKFANSFTLIPPLAWGNLQLFEEMTATTANNKCNSSNSEIPKTHSRNPSKTDSIKPERVLKSEIALPIDPLQDMDVLEQFLFRVNLIGWTNKKSFEEIWVTFLSALQGNGTHWAIRGMMQMILKANFNYCGRDMSIANPSIKKLKEVAYDCNIYDKLFYDLNIEKVPFHNCDLYSYSQVSIEYLKHAAGLSDTPDIKVQNSLSESKKELQQSGIDINSCVHLLMDIASQVFPQMDWGLSARSALLCCIVNISDAFTSKLQWQWLSRQLSDMNCMSESSDILTQQYIIFGQAKVNCVLGNEIPDINQLSAALSSSFAPIRVAALHASIMYLTQSSNSSFIFMEPNIRSGYEQFNALLEMQLVTTIKPHLVPYAVVSYNEQSLCWSTLFALVICGNNELHKVAIDFCFNNPYHFCSDLLLRGICQMTLIKGPTAANDIKMAIFKILDNQPEECYNLLPLLLTQIYSSNEMQTVENSLEPEQLLVHLQTFACLQRSITLSPLKYSKNICTSIIHCLKNFLPPAAVLNKIVQEFLDCCRWADSCFIDKNIAHTKGRIGLNLAPSYAELLANVVFEVFETGIAQDQLLILNGWLFDVLGHLLKGKVSANLAPFGLLCLICCASSNNFIRSMTHIINYTLKIGCLTNINASERKSQNMENSIESILSFKPKTQSSQLKKMNFDDMRLLCLGAVHSNFTKSQMEKLKLICAGAESLNDLKMTLNAICNTTR